MSTLTTIDLDAQVRRQRRLLSELCPSTEGALPPRFPSDVLLPGCSYYAGSRLDGSVVHAYCGPLLSFVGVDYLVEEARVREAVGDGAGFRGYRLLGLRAVSEDELAPPGRSPGPLAAARRPRGFFRRTVDGFALWMVFERRSGFGPGHGPERFSYLHVGGEAVSTYEALFVRAGRAPAQLAIVQPGFPSLAWTDLESSRALFSTLVLGHLPCPPYLVWGGFVRKSSHYRPACWPAYPHEVARSLHDGGGRLVLYRHERAQPWAGLEKSMPGRSGARRPPVGGVAALASGAR